ncbi:MAG: Zn-dependent hydrolase [Bacteroidales bacterium]|nr:Zn-dependent hydrolase [Bacteroidales bacterium]MCF8402489.1 Zn-dependent hydrolase [Bacteroidales bacterium]
MVQKNLVFILIATLMFSLLSCSNSNQNNSAQQTTDEQVNEVIQQKLDIYVPVKLTADISHLSDNEKEMLKLLFEASGLMDDIFWKQNVGEKEAFLSSLPDKQTRAFATINYGPWDELDDLKPFVEGYGDKPAGAEFYPHDMSKEEFEAYEHENKTSLYTIIRRNENGGLETQWYHEAFKDEIVKAADLLLKASALAGDKEFANYLKLRSEALLTDDYQESDMAWLDVKDNNVDLVIGPIENYTDQLFGYKAAQEAYILIKDKVWSDKLSKYAAFLPQLQTELPVDPIYKKEIPGSDADLNAYDVVFYAGDCNMAGKTIAINLPNDEGVQLKKGTRKLQLKNAMKAKFDYILVPIANELISKDQLKHITFDAFFSNTMFHEVAHGMGIKNTIDGKGTVRHALKETYSGIEEGKADILGLYLVTKLHEMGEFTETDLMDNYVTFMAGIFRSVRFGAASAHGKSNMVRFNFFKEKGAFSTNENGKYVVDMEKMKIASTELIQLILEIQGKGDYKAAEKILADMGVIPADLQSELDKLSDVGIPVDIVFEQGPEILGL